MIMKYIIIASLGFILSFQSLTAQHTSGEVHLKDGTVVKGLILQQGVDKGVTIRDSDGAILRYEEEEILTIKQRAGRAGSSHGGIFVRKKGFYQRFSFGLGFTESNDTWDGTRIQSVTTTLDAVSGWRFSPKVNLGLGVGVAFQPDGSSYTPVYLDFRGDWDISGSNKAVVPHYFLDLGYGFAGGTSWRRRIEQHDGGLFVHGGLGLKFRCRGRAEWTFTTGLRRQNAYEEYTTWNDPNTVIIGNRAKQSLEFQLGFMF
jgi:hypothetical protein